MTTVAFLVTLAFGFAAGYLVAKSGGPTGGTTTGGWSAESESDGKPIREE